MQDAPNINSHENEKQESRYIDDSGSGSLPTGGQETVTADAAATALVATEQSHMGPFENGYHFPPSHNWKESTRLGAIAFWNYTWTPIGFFVVLYGLLIVAWGGKLFLLLINAAPAMCHPSCEHVNSPRQKWIEIDSQILNALFCVTGFGLAPWRFRDLWYLLKYRIRHEHDALRHLAGIHRGWFRLEGSDHIPSTIGPKSVGELDREGQSASIPLPEEKISKPPLTGIRAPPTPLWKMDFVIWFNISNTFLQCVLSGLMWGMTRHNRPAWAVGLAVALACGAGATGGFMMFHQGKQVKKIEGVPISEKDLQQLARDKELGVTHFNNIKDKLPKKRKEKKPRWYRREKNDSSV